MKNNLIEIPSRTFVATASDELLRLDRFLLRKGISDSRDIIKIIIERGGVLVNDRHVTFPSKRVKEGYRIFLRHILFPQTPTKVDELKIIHQDECIVIVYKPAGVLSLNENKSSFSAERMLRKFLAGENCNVFPVHRLDRETSGVMIFARTKKAQEFIKKQFADRMVHKRYLALVQGNMKSNSGRLKGIMRTSGEFAESDYKIMEEYKHATLLEVYPKTGRTNQIRIQFSEIGHPLVGEYKYIRSSRGTCIISRRLCLHSSSISFIHPVERKKVTFLSNIPDELNFLINFLNNS